MKNFISSSAERIIQAKFISLCPLNRCENVTEKELCIFLSIYSTIKIVLLGPQRMYF